MIANIVINGASGTMGRVIASLALQYPDQYKIVAGVDCIAGTGNGGFPIYSSFDDIAETFDAIVDFSVPAALPSVLRAAKNYGCGAVIATTGLSDHDRQQMQEASQHVPIFFSANMSLGVNLQTELIKQAASFLGEQFDIEILEKHHNQKVDAPSGTALMLADAVRSQFVNGKEYIYDRSSVREKRKKNAIGLSAVRGGTVVGEHQVLFLGTDEVLEITHIAHSKNIFAVGALRAARFLIGKEPRIYSMPEIVAYETRVTALNIENNQSIITIKQAFSSASLAQLFNSLININIDMISKTRIMDGVSTISFTVPTEHIDSVKSALDTIHITDIDCIDHVSKCCIEGNGMEYVGGVAAEIFDVIEKANASPLVVSTSESKVSICLPEEEVQAFSQAMIDQFNL